MKFVMFLVGLLVVFVLGFLISADRKKIKYKPIAIMLIIQLALSYFLFNTQVGYILVKGISDGFGALLGYAEAGIVFVFGGLVNKESFILLNSVITNRILCGFNRNSATL